MGLTPDLLNIASPLYFLMVEGQDLVGGGIHDVEVDVSSSGIDVATGRRILLPVHLEPKQDALSLCRQLVLQRMK